MSRGKKTLTLLGGLQAALFTAPVKTLGKKAITEHLGHQVSGYYLMFRPSLFCQKLRIIKILARL